MRPVVLALAALATLAMVLRQKLNGHVSLLTLPEASGSAVVSAELGRMDEGVAEKLAEAWRSEQRAAASFRAAVGMADHAAAYMHALPPPPSETLALASGQSLLARALAPTRPEAQQLARTTAGQLAWEDKLAALLHKKEEAKHKKDEANLQAEEDEEEEEEEKKEQEQEKEKEKAEQEQDLVAAAEQVAT
jgi:hypothetical protein